MKLRGQEMPNLLGDFHSSTHAALHTFCITFVHFTKQINTIIDAPNHFPNLFCWSCINLFFLVLLLLTLSLRVSDCLFFILISNLAFSNCTTEKPKASLCSFSTVLAAPILSVRSLTCDSIALSWKAVPMAAGFSVSLMRSDGLGRMLKQNTTNTSLIFTNLDPGTLYTIKAYAWNANGMPGDDFAYNQRTSKKFSFLFWTQKPKPTQQQYTRRYIYVYVCDHIIFFKDPLSRFSGHIFTQSQNLWKLRWHSYV